MVFVAYYNPTTELQDLEAIPLRKIEQVRTELLA